MYCEVDKNAILLQFCGEEDADNIGLNVTNCKCCILQHGFQL